MVTDVSEVRTNIFVVCIRFFFTIFDNAGSIPLTSSRRAPTLSVILDTTYRKSYSEPMFQMHSAKHIAPRPPFGISGDDPVEPELLQRWCFQSPVGKGDIPMFWLLRRHFRVSGTRAVAGTESSCRIAMRDRKYIMMASRQRDLKP